MHKDDHLMFESYIKKIEEVKASPSNFSGTPVKPVGKFANSPVKPGYDAIQNTIDQKLAAKKQKSEDEEAHCKHAEEGCDCDGCQECKANQTQSEDAESSDSIAIKELHSLIDSLNHHYLSGADLDNETLGNIIAELEDILNVGFGSPHEDEESVEDKMAKIEAKRAQRKNIGEVR